MYLQQILWAHIVTKKYVKPGPRNIQAAKNIQRPGAVTDFSALIRLAA
jgi:hypothetical protein